MNTLFYILLALFLVALLVLFVVLFIQGKRLKSYRDANEVFMKSFKEDNERFMKEFGEAVKEYHKESKEDYERSQSSQREEISERFKDLNNSFAEKVGLFAEVQKNQLSNLTDSQKQAFSALTESQRTQLDKLQQAQELRLKSMEDSQREKLSQMESTQKERLTQIEKTQSNMILSTEKSLEQMRSTVEEKLEKTLNERISRSFETVGKQLDTVKEGLTQMRDLAKDVGGLKKVLSNVKMRGGLGEVQLQMLLEQYLSPAQFVTNAHTGANKDAVVEFAVKFPGQDGTPVLLPIDAKFPKDKYEALLQAYDKGEKEEIDVARKELSNAVKNNAKEIAKYINVPVTTQFAIMFLPFEGLYAEVARDAMLLENIQKEYNVTIAGPTNLAAILTSFQLGFRTLAIQKKGNDVWRVLGEVKSEFGKFGDMLEKAKGNIQKGLDDMDKLVGTRTRAINRRLKDVEVLDAPEQPARELEEE